MSLTAKPLTFALYFGNRGFFPADLIADARREVAAAVEQAGHRWIAPELTLTRYGAVETAAEGRAYAGWLAAQKGRYDGVILSLPNFGDENGAATALRDAGVPILIQAYPDEIGKMDFAHRRDAYCGKFSITDVLRQYQIPFTILKPHVVHPLTDAFADNLRVFAGICRVVRGMRRFSIGAIGARTTAFKTCRYDEITLQKYGITVETFDLSDLFARVERYADTDAKVISRLEFLRTYTDCAGVPEEKMVALAKVHQVLHDYIETYQLDAITLRCWTELQSVLGIAPCVLLSMINDRQIAASCEIDLLSAINMRSLTLASEEPATVLDWNNNYGEDPDKVILFHCGPVPKSLMTDQGRLTEHKMFAKENPGCGWGTDEGRIRAFPMTFTNCKTEEGKLTFYIGQGQFTEDPIEEAFFGCAGVAQIPDLQNTLLQLGREGFKHHTAVGVGHLQEILEQAFVYYLGYDLLPLG